MSDDYPCIGCRWLTMDTIVTNHGITLTLPICTEDNSLAVEKCSHYIKEE